MTDVFFRYVQSLSNSVSVVSALTFVQFRLVNFLTFHIIILCYFMQCTEPPFLQKNEDRAKIRRYGEDIRFLI